MRAVSDMLNKLSDGLNRVALVGAALAVAIMLAAAGWQVIARYLLNQPPIWTEAGTVLDGLGRVAGRILCLSPTA